MEAEWAAVRDGQIDSWSGAAGERVDGDRPAKRLGAKRRRGTGVVADGTVASVAGAALVTLDVGDRPTRLAMKVEQ